MLYRMILPNGRTVFTTDPSPPRIPEPEGWSVVAPGPLPVTEAKIRERMFTAEQKRDHHLVNPRLRDAWIYEELEAKVAFANALATAERLRQLAVEGDFKPPLKKNRPPTVSDPLLEFTRFLRASKKPSQNGLCYRSRSEGGGCPLGCSLILRSLSF